MRRALWLLAGVLVLCGAVWLLLREGRTWLFERNSRFALRQVEVESTGYWAKNVETRRQLCSLAGLQPGGGVTVFGDRLQDIRERLELIPSVEAAMVERVLPDKLKIRLEERIPRASLNTYSSGLVIDSYGVVMDNRFCQSARGDLPVLMTGRNDWRPGMVGEELKSALELLLVIQRQFPDIRVLVLNAADAELMNFKINFRGLRVYQVWMKPEKYVLNLQILQSACEQAIATNDPHTIANMLYNVGVTWQ